VPGGLVYQPDFLTEAEEQGPCRAGGDGGPQHHPAGQTARRTVPHFGVDDGYESWTLVSTDPPPDDLAWLQEQAAALTGLDPDLVQILVSDTRRGARP
jgi:hypothetical protein